MTIPKEIPAATGIANRDPISNTYSPNYTLDADYLARVLGGEVIGRDAIIVPGPGHSDDDRSLSIKLDPGFAGGFIVHSFAGDDLRSCRAHVEAAIGPLAFADAPPPLVPDSKEWVDDWWRKTWGHSQPAQGTLVETYLRLRGVDVPYDDVRYHPNMKRKDSWGPGMVAIYREPLTLKERGIHRTFIDPTTLDRTEKLCLGSMGQCAAVMFGDTKPGETLAIAEGIETALSVKQMGWPHPIWAVITAGGIARFPVLPGVRNLVIYADRDGEPHYTGEKAAEDCAVRWRAAGRRVDIKLPQTPGADWNDVIRGRAQ